MTHKSNWVSSFGLCLCSAMLLIAFSSPCLGKYIGPNTSKLVKVSDLIAVVEAKWVMAADRPRDTCGEVTADLLYVLKGDAGLKEVVIGVKNRMEAGDYGAYCPQHRYLVFLVLKGSIYETAFGSSGVFEIDDGCVDGWPEPGSASYPKPDTLVKWELVSSEIKRMLPEGRFADKRPVWQDLQRPVGTYRGPGVDKLTAAADIIALVETRWVTPWDKPEVPYSQPYSRVLADVVDTIKGQKPSQEPVIATSNDPENGDAGCFCPGRRCLVFLIRKGEVYRTAYGRAGVFRMDGNLVIGWPQSGHPSYPRPPTLSSYKLIKEQIAK